MPNTKCHSGANRYALFAAAQEDAVRTSRIYESDIKIPTLRYLKKQQSGFATTSGLISHLAGEFKPTGKDAETLNSRSDSKFSQIVRNMVSNRNHRGNVVNDGYAKYVRQRRGLLITESGRRLIFTLPDQNSSE